MLPLWHFLQYVSFSVACMVIYDPNSFWCLCSDWRVNRHAVCQQWQLFKVSNVARYRNHGRWQGQHGTFVVSSCSQFSHEVLEIVIKTVSDSKRDCLYQTKFSNLTYELKHVERWPPMLSEVQLKVNNMTSCWASDIFLQKLVSMVFQECILVFHLYREHVTKSPIFILLCPLLPFRQKIWTVH